MANSAGGRDLQLNMWKDAVALLRDLLLLVIGVLLVIWPAQFNSVLVRAGFEEGSVVGFKWRAKLEESDQALKDATAAITDLKQQNEKLTKALADAQAGIVDPAAKARLAELQQESQKLKESTDRVGAAARATIASNAPLVERAQQAMGDTHWAVVYGGDTKLEDAKYEVTTIAKKLELPNASIYLRQGSYRSVAPAGSREEAEQVLSRAKTRRKDAYIVNLNKWCPNASRKGDYFECTGV